MKPKRIQLSRAKGWRMPPHTVKVDRTTCFGNVVKIGADAQVEGVDGCMYYWEVSPAIAVAIHREIVLRRVKRDPTHLEILRGMNLACWCKLGEPCHADTLLELANK